METGQSTRRFLAYDMMMLNGKPLVQKPFKVWSTPLQLVVDKTRQAMCDACMSGDSLLTGTMASSGTVRHPSAQHREGCHRGAATGIALRLWRRAVWHSEERFLAALKGAVPAAKGAHVATVHHRASYLCRTE